MNVKVEKKILILSANPKDSARRRLDEEVREIEEGLQRSKYRDQFHIKSKWAVRIRDLRRAILDYEPDIVHFCGHGEKDGIMVEDEGGNAILVDLNALAGLFELFANKVDCVLLNACYSEPQVKIVSQYINYVIGMKRGIQEKTAIEFALGFYDALGAGKPVEEAFKFGRNAVQLYNISEQLIPILKTKSKKSKRSKPLKKNDNDSVIQKRDALGEEEDKATVRKSKKLLLQSLIFLLFLGFILVLFVVIPDIKEPEISYVTNEIENQDFIFSSVSWPFELDPKGEDITSNYTTGGYPGGVVPRFPFSSQYPTIAANKMCIKFHFICSGQQSN